MKQDTGYAHVHQSLSTPAISARRGYDRVLLGLAFAVVVMALYRTAWLSDDGLISLRVAINFLDGLGPVWWPGERVQSFTHPLWLFLMMPGIALSGEPYIATLVLSAILTLGALVLIAAGDGNRAAYSHGSRWNAAFFILALTASRSFVDYATSGLENPLSYVLIALFWRALRSLNDQKPQSAFTIMLCASLILLNRLDFAVWLLPVGLMEFYGILARRQGVKQWRSWVGWSGLGMAPLLGWLIFATIYYGSPLPNTYFAKLHGGHEASEYWAKGWDYLTHFPGFDPAGALLLVAGLIAGLTGGYRSRGFSLGIVFYIAYIVSVGGDFMAGRFFSVPIFAAILLLSQARLRTGFAMMLTIAAIAAGSSHLPVLSPADYRVPWRGHAVADERGVYYTRFGLRQPDGSLRTDWPAVVDRQPARDRAAIKSVMFYCGGIGRQGLFVQGNDVYPDDLCGLTDAFIARLPALDEPYWRVGHLKRAVPPGYRKTLLSGQNAIVGQPGVARLYDDVSLVTRGPIWSASRWLAIWRLHTDDYLPDAERAFYRDPKNLQFLIPSPKPR